MSPTALIEVLKKFDKDAEVKMNKISAGGYNNFGSGSYHWTFHGNIKGEETRLKLVRTGPKEYTLYRSRTVEVEEVIKV